ncbi:MAG: hypothetical protein Q4G35_01095 [Propionibacteriaceae bacterium]|nr:hypothetical protein [Propionibacteriaceae bacterium]
MNLDLLGPTISSVVPILLLIGLGVLLRRLDVISEAAVEGFKRLVVNVVLPAVLFLAFLGLQWDPTTLWLVVLVPALCFLLLGIGYLIPRWLGTPRVSPFLFTGFEFGMVGLALFTAAYGMEHAPAAAIVGLGHEFFIWFVFVTLLKRQSDGAVSLGATLRSFVTSPVIIAIAAGLILNLAGLQWFMTGNIVAQPLTRTLEFLAGMIVPLILIIVGYGTQLTRAGVRQAAPFVAVRFAVCLVLAVVVVFGILGAWLGLPQPLQAALFMLLILPPPFIVPLFLPASRASEITFANNVLSLYTLVSVVAFLTYVAFVPVLN